MTDRKRLSRSSKIMSMIPKASSSQESTSDLILSTSSKENISLINDIDSDLEFDSDDSVFDKDYVPSSIEQEISSADSDCSVDYIPNSQPTHITVPESAEVSIDELEPSASKDKLEPGATNHVLEPEVTNRDLEPEILDNELEPEVTNCELEHGVMNHEFASEVTNRELEPEDLNNELEPEVTNHELEPGIINHVLEPGVTNRELEPEVTNRELEPVVSNNELEPVVSNNEVETPTNLTKNGLPRKRKMFENSPAQRKAMKKLSDMETKYQLKSGCQLNKCKKKCHSQFTEEERRNINIYFRNMSWKEQRYFLINNTSKEQPKRKTVTENRKIERNVTVSYFLRNETGTKINVCKVFFLETLGYKRKNDKSLRNALDIITNITPVDNRGSNANPKKLDETVIIQHINSFNPSISHYRREHAPNRRYLPSDLTVVKMYQDFCEKRSDLSVGEVSYEAYRKIVKKLNICFTKLGHEQCEACEIYFIHNPDYKEKRHRNCNKCRDYEVHHEKYTTARQAYKTDVENQNSNVNADTAYYAADLEKVIMLPRMEEFKKVVFCPRIIVFNESFVPIGDKKNNPSLKTFAAIWHEAISGRKVIDITSCFKSFLMSVRDLRHLVIWLDNCASQNKNWTLFSYFLQVINSVEVNFETITLKYLEVGHTHMSADEFHHQVEVAMKRKKHLYDFEDFNQAVLSTRTNITVKSMNVDDFYQFEDCSSVYKLQNSSPRAYLADMCQVTFTRGDHVIRYKTAFYDENEFYLDFLKLKNIKSGIPLPKPITRCRGITLERKTEIIQKLTPLMPENRRAFWHDLPVNMRSVDLTQFHED